MTSTETRQLQNLITNFKIYCSHLKDCATIQGQKFNKLEGCTCGYSDELIKVQELEILLQTDFNQLLDKDL